MITPLRTKRALAASVVLFAVSSPHWLAPDAAAQAASPEDAWTQAVAASQASLPPGDDAWPSIAGAAAEYQRVLRQVRLDAGDGSASPLVIDARLFILAAGDEASSRLQSLAVRSVEALDASAVPALLEKAASAPRCVQPFGNNWVAELLSSTATKSDADDPSLLGQYLACRFVASVRASDAGAAADRLRVALRFCHHLSQGPLHRRFAAARTLDALALGIREEVMARRISGTVAAGLLRVIDAHAPSWDPALTIELERVSLSAMLRDIADQRPGIGERVFARALGACGLDERPDVAERVPALIALERAAPTAEVLIRCLESAARSDARSRAAARAFLDPVAVADLLDCETHALARHLAHTWGFADTLLTQTDAARSRFEAARIMLACEAFEARTGSAPAWVADLVPTELNAAPVDPVNGLGFVVRRIPDPAADLYRRRYLIIGLGIDGRDDAGKTPESAPDRVLEAAGAAGFDRVYNEPERP